MANIYLLHVALIVTANFELRTSRDKEVGSRLCLGYIHGNNRGKPLSSVKGSIAETLQRENHPDNKPELGASMLQYHVF